MKPALTPKDGDTYNIRWEYCKPNLSEQNSSTKDYTIDGLTYTITVNYNSNTRTYTATAAKKN